MAGLFFIDVLLLLLRTRRRWPPQYLPAPTVLSRAAGIPDNPPREEWGAREWQEYAILLEKRGAKELLRLEGELLKASRKLARRKSVQEAGRQATVLSQGAPRIHQKRGRKPTGKRERSAAEILAIRAELEESTLARVTDELALKEWFRRKGQRYGGKENNRNLLNAVSELRRKITIITDR